ncbi:hypothetical protein [Anoxynatronum sibiricum]|uniref:Uncharacterized protein n=1 Tax=Anoxynatronum sibiricum TaxID=210623 RepID=A0ABU9VXL9_9CLOT
MLRIKISYREQPHAKEAHQFSAKVNSPLEAIQLFYDKHPDAVWIGVRSIRLLDDTL